MTSSISRRSGRLAALAAALLLGSAAAAPAAIQGVGGPVVNLTAKDGYIQTPDGNSIYMWGFAHNNGAMQYPGPTLDLPEDVAVTVNLANRLPVPVSIVFPGQGAVATAGGVPGLLAAEAPPGGSVSYTFTPDEPGTYTYHSGSRSDLQIEMGLLGAIVVRPTGYDPLIVATWQAYHHADSAYDHEHLFLLTEIDPAIHDTAETGNLRDVDTARFFPVYWFINGRAAPDTMADANVPWLPSQPYNCMPQAHPGERLLMRMVGGNRDLHPFHTHGNHHDVIARNGRLLGSAPASGADNAEAAFTSTVFPGQTADAIYTWTGAGLGWDVYGPIDAACTDADNDGLDDTTAKPCHDATCTDAGADGFDDATGEWCADHGKPFPVVLPDQQSLAFGMWYSGSPFLGSSEPLPPGEGGLNPNNGYFFMFHSHNEKEIVNFDVFPGGMLIMMDIEPPGVPLVNP